jgi:hypothetical protein
VRPWLFYIIGCEKMSDVIVVQDVYKQFGKRGQPLWIRKFWHKKTGQW